MRRGGLGCDYCRVCMDCISWHQRWSISWKGLGLRKLAGTIKVLIHYWIDMKTKQTLHHHGFMGQDMKGGKISLRFRVSDRLPYLP